MIGTATGAATGVGRPWIADLDTPAAPTGTERATAFDALLAGRASRLVRDDGRPVPADPGRWRAVADADDALLLDRCAGSVLDLGCGPGRLVAALVGRGLPALGVDSSAVAGQLCRQRGAPVLVRDLFGPLPGEGGWCRVLLADGNIGIGGDPLRLLARIAWLLAPAGTALVEVGPDPAELWRGAVRVVGTAAWSPWACVGADALRALAPAAGLRPTAVIGPTRTGRSFLELTRSPR